MEILNNKFNLKFYDRTFVFSRVAKGIEPFLLSEICNRFNDKNILVVLEDNEQIKIYKEIIKINLNNYNIVTFPCWDCFPYDNNSPDQTIVSNRFKAIRNYYQNTGSNNLILTSLDSLLLKIPPVKKSTFENLKLKTGEKYKHSFVVNTLNDLGYNRVELVLSPYEFASRGGIIDFWPVGEEKPLRLDFFDELLEEIKEFNPLNQISLNKKKYVNLFESIECPLSTKSKQTFISNYRKKFGPVINTELFTHTIQNTNKIESIEHWLPLFYENKLISQFELFNPDIIICDENIKQNASEKLELINNTYREKLEVYRNNKDEYNAPLEPDELYMDAKSLNLKIDHKDRIFFTYLDQIENENTFNIKSKDNIEFDKNYKFEKIKEKLNKTIHENFNKKKIIFCYANPTEKKHLKSLLSLNQSIEYRFDTPSIMSCLKNSEYIDIIKMKIKKGFENEFLKLITTQEISKVKNIIYSRPLKNNIIDISQININDYVVHVEHGIGKYLGLKAIQIVNRPHDCLIIEYASNSKLYVPVENIKLISRYGNSNVNVELDKLGSSYWTSKKVQIRKKIRDLANSLLEQAAKRKISKGIKINIDNEKLRKFSALFNYNETDDQLATLQEVYNDLSKGQLMDRLVCGDVGFGKTEVAIRAAYLMSENSYKTLIIVPTTILAMQHYNNFSKRFENYTGVGIITRNTSTSRKKEVLKEFASNGMDILISTHAAFSIDFKNIKLGLLVIDEEQHFGVAQKEKIKKIKNDLHLLTLTATPIPRTLHMSLLGIRGLSLIQTPPVDRKSIKTVICKLDNIIIKNAISKEIDRNGQIFIITPQIKDIESLKKRIERIFPNIKYVVAHGKLRAQEIEKVMNEFYHHKADILISTSIIESGIDIPRANTLIINNADRFGLAQLHQIRGRIGRSHLKSYAYFTIDKNTITPNAKRRLKAIQAMDALGAGINLANYDLDIRGAGNLLGEEQSGQISQIGIELYQRLLKECLDDIKGIKNKKHISSIDITIKLPVLIPENYIPDLSLRLSIYRKLGDVINLEEIDQFKMEMNDRFGKIPNEFNNLINVIILKILASNAFIQKIQVNSNKYILVFDESYEGYTQDFVDWIENKKNRISLKSTHIIEIEHSIEQVEEQLLNVIELVNIMLKLLYKDKIIED